MITLFILLFFPQLPHAADRVLGCDLSLYDLKKGEVRELKLKAELNDPRAELTFAEGDFTLNARMFGDRTIMAKLSYRGVASTSIGEVDLSRPPGLRSVSTILSLEKDVAFSTSCTRL